MLKHTHLEDDKLEFLLDCTWTWKALKMPSTKNYDQTQEHYLLIDIPVQKKLHSSLTAKKNCSLLSFKESSYSWKQLLVHVFNNHILWGEITLKATNFFFFSSQSYRHLEFKMKGKKNIQQDFVLNFHP